MANFFRRRRWIAVLLALALILLTVGCSSTPEEPTGTQSPTEGTEPEITVTCQYLPKAVDNPDNLPVLKWVCLTERIAGGGKRTWNETAVHELNQMLADRNMPFRVQFAMLTMDQWLEYSDWFSRPEAQEALKDADLIYGVMRNEDMLKYLMPITEYVTGAAEPSLKNSVSHEANWIETTIDGQIYGIAAYPYQAWSHGWRIDAGFLAQYGLSEEDFSYSFWEMDNIFADIYSKNGNKPFLYITPDDLTYYENSITKEMKASIPRLGYDMYYNVFQLIGSCFAIDYNTQTPTVVNMVETVAVRNIQEAVVRYKAAGYIIPDSNGVEMNAQVRYIGTIGNRTYYAENGDLYIPITHATFQHSWRLTSGVSADSKHQKEAVSLLNLIAEDEAFRMQLFYGKEGRDYTITNGYYTIMNQEDGSNYSLDMLSPLSFFCGLTSDVQSANLLSPGTENWDYISYEGKSAQQSYQENLDSSIICYPIIFDYSGFEQEVAAMEAVFGKYFPKFTKLSAEVYEQMIQELKDAGSDKVQAELQRQLEQWQKENPDW